MASALRAGANPSGAKSTVFCPSTAGLPPPEPADVANTGAPEVPLHAPAASAIACPPPATAAPTLGSTTYCTFEAGPPPTCPCAVCLGSNPSARPPHTQTPPPPHHPQQ